MKLLQALYCRSKYSERFVMGLLCALKATHAHEAGSGISALMRKQSADESGTNVFTPPSRGVGLVEPSRSYASRPLFENLTQPGCQSTDVFLCACVCRARASAK